jgi:hypothetical protein
VAPVKDLQCQKLVKYLWLQCAIQRSGDLLSKLIEVVPCANEPFPRLGPLRKKKECFSETLRMTVMLNKEHGRVCTTIDLLHMARPIFNGTNTRHFHLPDPSDFWRSILDCPMRRSSIVASKSLTLTVRHHMLHYRIHGERPKILSISFVMENLSKSKAT